MAQDQFKRKPTTILSADVTGYSRLMQDDDAATVKNFESCKQVFFDLIKQHRGGCVAHHAIARRRFCLSQPDERGWEHAYF